MQYLGSKNRIAKHILPLIKERLKPEQWYVEPFMGGANMMDKVDHPYRIGNDFNYQLIELWRALQRGWIPPENVREEEYAYLKQAQDIEDPALVAFTGFLVSFAGKWFAGYARNKKNDNYAKRGHTDFISKDFITGIILCSFGISYFWSHNVKRVAFGKEIDRMIYAAGAMAGGVTGFYLGKILINL